MSALMVLVPDQTIHPTHTVPATQSAGPKPVSAKTSPATWAMGSRWPLEVAASAAVGAESAAIDAVAVAGRTIED